MGAGERTPPDPGELFRHDRGAGRGAGAARGTGYARRGAGRTGGTGSGASAGAGRGRADRGGKGLPLHALVSRFPVLSSLLPPKKPEGKRTQTSDLALILGVLLLLAGEQDDILPILLVLLLA